ncbi:PEPxxWA-CTERM sorting domain-containing protein [Novosphingobium sp. G106]|uniref:PEPxxWA-CTERM sorting domain-containing protein n=1 Tax=Novosphingobium sp. G106 TaxID=2849500 RepID=UPI001C2D66CB|nr:PEPxxWA-CTERM sorting domain-containing protein [Novosphingobium sp. G106]MBV1688265.1 PEPxxWA-CTERM sorting domain-containing protein [Novosphingobium sp. G106]
MFIAVPAHATVYDAFSSFNGTQNAGNFLYFGLTGLAPPNGAALFNDNSNCVLNLTCLQLSSNIGGAAFYKSTLAPFPAGTVTVPNDMLIALPDEKGVLVNFIAPTTGTYNITASFTALDSLANGVGIFAIAPGNVVTPVIAPNTVPNNASFTKTLSLAQGQGFGFVIGPGMVADNDVTGFNFKVTSVPEPVTWAMMIVGFGLVGGAMRRQRRMVRYDFA